MGRKNKKWVPFPTCTGVDVTTPNSNMHRQMRTHGREVFTTASLTTNIFPVASTEYPTTIGRKFFCPSADFSKLNYIYCKDHAEHGDNNNYTKHMNHAQNLQE